MIHLNLVIRTFIQFEMWAVFRNTIRTWIFWTGSQLGSSFQNIYTIILFWSSSYTFFEIDNSKLIDCSLLNYHYYSLLHLLLNSLSVRNLKYFWNKVFNKYTWFTYVSVSLKTFISHNIKTLFIMYLHSLLGTSIFTASI